MLGHFYFVANLVNNIQTHTPDAAAVVEEAAVAAAAAATSSPSLPKSRAA